MLLVTTSRPDSALGIGKPGGGRPALATHVRLRAGTFTGLSSPMASGLGDTAGTSFAALMPADPSFAVCAWLWQEKAKDASVRIAAAAIQQGRLITSPL
jgi:hypothetical protein